MKTFKHIVGIILLALIFIGLFTLTAIGAGFINALLVWITAILITAVVVLALMLILD